MTEPRHTAWRVLAGDGKTSYTITADSYFIDDNTHTLTLADCEGRVATFRPGDWTNIVAVDVLDMTTHCYTAQDRHLVLHANILEELKGLAKSVKRIRSADRDGDAALRSMVRIRRKALQVVEWANTTDLSGNKRDFCPWCHHYKEIGHSVDCMRQLALDN
jgi:hypothetical protein